MDIDLGLFYGRLLAIALIMVLGFFLGRRKMITHETGRQLVNLLLSVFMPAALFGAFMEEYDAELLGLFLAGLLGGMVVMLLLIVLAKVIYAWQRGELKYEAQFAMVFNNASFLGYPIVANTFGVRGIVAYCGFIVMFNLALFSYGVYLFERKVTARSLLEVVRNPNIIAVVLGMVVFLSGARLPEFVTDAVGFVGAATTPLSIICIGVMLARADLKALVRRGQLILVAILQLVLGPVVTYFVLRLIGMPGEVVTVCTLIQALPTATSLSLFATKYGGNEIEASELVAISTVLSIVTLPVMITVLLS